MGGLGGGISLSTSLFLGGNVVMTIVAREAWLHQKLRVLVDILLALSGTYMSFAFWDFLINRTIK